MKTNKFVLLNFILLAVILPFQNCSTKIQSEASLLSNIPESSNSDSNGSDVPVVVPAPAVVPTGIMKTVIFAAGQNERTAMSCDDGETWFNDRSADESARGEIVQGHSPRSFYGISNADGYTYINYGWGYNGSLKRSRDGLNWEVIRSGSWGGGVAAFSNQVFHAGPDWSTSSTFGSTWNKLTNIGTVASGISYGAVYKVDNSIFIAGRAENMAASYDKGSTWTLLTNVLPTKSESRSFASGNGAIVTVGKTYNYGQISTGFITSSTDGGKTWSSVQMGNDWTTVIFNGTHFVAWTNATDNGRVYKSTDGKNWTNTFVKINGQNAGWYFAPAAAYNKKTGNYVYVSGGNGDYSAQTIYKSTDGINWIKSDPSKFKIGHYISSTFVGEIDSAYCN